MTLYWNVKNHNHKQTSVYFGFILEVAASALLSAGGCPSGFKLTALK